VLTTTQAVTPVYNAGVYNAGVVQRMLQEGPVLLFGAGQLGRRLLALLRSKGLEATAFLDNSRAGEQVDGIPVIGPAEAALRYGSRGVFVTASYRPATSSGMSAMRHQLLDLGCAQVIPFPWVLWALQGGSHFLWDQPGNMDRSYNEVEAAARLFHDAKSRSLFRRQMAFRETADADLLPPLSGDHPQYFPPWITPSDLECFVDCGAYTGDSLAPLLSWNPDFARAVAFEADPATFARLREFTRSSGLEVRVDCRQLAVSASAGLLRFSANGQSNAALAADGDVEVRAVPLDSELEGLTPTFIKMDIEGAEMDALLGARETIRRCQPVLAICVYHRQDDLWRIPLFLRELMPDAALFLRAYCLDAMETVCYAVPRNRLAS
jgi:FkbM family methyltransferase